MTMGPDKIATPIDLLGGTGTATGTYAGGVITLPPGRKAFQISAVTSATLTMKIQGSLDKANWFDVAISTNTSMLGEIDSVVPWWRANITSFSTLGTGTAPAAVVMITQGPV